ncbi:sex-determining region Y protein-like [Labrus bergylta]|uniref:sex-determining region Y protein-like n=1 Tax=Labrus bergylta TaxID=56723 RepID=UPI003313DF65
MNAFLVWSYIHRCTLKKLNQGFCKRDTSTRLGHEWSKLSKEEKRPYFEMANKIKRIHHQKFPEYVFRPQRKSSKECLSSGQRTGPDISLSASRPIPLVQSEFQGPGMKSTKIRSASSMKEAGNHRNSHPQRDKRDLASLHTIKQQTHCTSDNSHEVMFGSTETSESHKQTDIVTSLQLLPNECDDYVDVVGLL